MNLFMCERGINFLIWFVFFSLLKICMFFNILISFERDIYIKNVFILFYFMYLNFNDL